MRAFWDLRSEAKDGDQTLGRIPWSKTRDYGAAEFGFGEDMHGNFWLVISSMDNALRTWHADEYERKIRQSKGNKSGLSSPFQLKQPNPDGSRYGR